MEEKRGSRVEEAEERKDNGGKEEEELVFRESLQTMINLAVGRGAENIAWKGFLELRQFWTIRRSKSTNMGKLETVKMINLKLSSQLYVYSVYTPK